MKDFIVLIAMIALGVFIATIILADNQEGEMQGLKGATRSLMEQNIAALTD